MKKHFDETSWQPFDPSAPRPCPFDDDALAFGLSRRADILDEGVPIQKGPCAASQPFHQTRNRASQVSSPIEKHQRVASITLLHRSALAFHAQARASALLQGLYQPQWLVFPLVVLRRWNYIASRHVRSQMCSVTTPRPVPQAPACISQPLCFNPSLYITASNALSDFPPQAGPGFHSQHHSTPTISILFSQPLNIYFYYPNELVSPLQNQS